MHRFFDRFESKGGGAVQGFKVQCRIDRNRALDVCKFLVETLWGFKSKVERE